MDTKECYLNVSNANFNQKCFWKTDLFIWVSTVKPYNPQYIIIEFTEKRIG